MAKTKKKARKTKKKAKKKSPRKPAARRTFLASGGEVLSRPDWSRTAGTSEQGQIRYSYNELKKILGPPTFLAERDEMGQEQSAEWQIQFPDGTFVMIYDYKQSPLYEPDMYGLDPEVEEVPASVMKKYRREKIDWSVNGKSPAAMAWVQYALGKRKSSPSAAKVVAGKAAGKRGGYMGELWRAFRGIDNPETKKWLSKAITRKGKLGGAGFLSKPVDTQKKILDRCVAQYGYRSCLGSVMVLERIPKTEAKYGPRLKTLRSWMVKTYGDPGVFGQRSGLAAALHGRPVGDPEGTRAAEGPGDRPNLGQRRQPPVVERLAPLLHPQHLAEASSLVAVDRLRHPAEDLERVHGIDQRDPGGLGRHRQGLVVRGQVRRAAKTTLGVGTTVSGTGSGPRGLDHVGLGHPGLGLAQRATRLAERLGEERLEGGLGLVSLGHPLGSVGPHSPHPEVAGVCPHAPHRCQRTAQLVTHVVAPRIDAGVDTPGGVLPLGPGGQPPLMGRTECLGLLVRHARLRDRGPELLRETIPGVVAAGTSGGGTLPRLHTGGIGSPRDLVQVDPKSVDVGPTGWLTGPAHPGLLARRRGVVRLGNVTHHEGAGGHLHPLHVAEIPRVELLALARGITAGSTRARGREVRVLLGRVGVVLGDLDVDFRRRGARLVDPIEAMGRAVASDGEQRDQGQAMG